MHPRMARCCAARAHAPLISATTCACTAATRGASAARVASRSARSSATAFSAAACSTSSISASGTSSSDVGSTKSPADSRATSSMRIAALRSATSNSDARAAICDTAFCVVSSCVAMSGASTSSGLTPLLAAAAMTAGSRPLSATRHSSTHAVTPRNVSRSAPTKARSIDAHAFFIAASPKWSSAPTTVTRNGLPASGVAGAPATLHSRSMRYCPPSVGVQLTVYEPSDVSVAGNAGMTSTSVASAPSDAGALTSRARKVTTSPPCVRRTPSASETTTRSAAALPATIPLVSPGPAATERSGSVVGKNVNGANVVVKALPPSDTRISASTSPPSMCGTTSGVTHVISSSATKTTDLVTSTMETCRVGRGRVTYAENGVRG